MIIHTHTSISLTRLKVLIKLKFCVIRNQSSSHKKFIITFYFKNKSFSTHYNVITVGRQLKYMYAVHYIVIHLPTATALHKVVISTQTCWMRITSTTTGLITKHATNNTDDSDRYCVIKQIYSNISDISQYAKLSTLTY